MLTSWCVQGTLMVCAGFLHVINKGNDHETFNDCIGGSTGALKYLRAGPEQWWHCGRRHLRWDLGWYFGLEFMMDALFGARPPGFPGSLEALERYERLSGYEVNDLAWHEVFALARALAINDRHQRITGDPRRRENPMGDILLARLEAASRSPGHR